jgi:ketosteroid isomerase-like protein
MSEENLEIVRRSYEDFNRRDFDALWEAWDPEIEWHQFTPFPCVRSERPQKALHSMQSEIAALD